LEYLVDTQLVAQESGGEILDLAPKKSGPEFMLGF